MCQFVRSPFCHPECNVANWSEIEGSVGVDCSRFLLHLRQPADHVASFAGVATFYSSIFLRCHLSIVIPVKTGIQSLGIPALLLQKPWIPACAGMTPNLASPALSGSECPASLLRKTLDSGLRKVRHWRIMWRAPPGLQKRRACECVLYILFCCPILNIVFYCVHG